MSRSIRPHRHRAGSAIARSALIAAAAGLPVGAGHAIAGGTSYGWAAASSGNFSDTSRWTPVGAPSDMADSASIEIDGVYTVTVDTNLTIDSLTMDAVGATLFAQSRTIDVAGELTLLDGTIESWSSTFTGVNPMTIMGGTFRARGTTTFGAGATNDGLLWVNGANTTGIASLVLSDGFTNTGTLRMESSNTSWQSNINISGGTLHNLAGGLVEVNQGSSGDRLFTGSLTNDGTITVNGSRVLSISDAGAFTVRHQGGMIDGTGEVRVNSGAFEWTGGDIDATVRVLNGTIDVDSTAGSGTVIAGGATSLVDNSRTAATVWVQGSSTGGDATLGLTGNAENRGTIRLESINTSWESSINTGAFTLTNRASGTIEVNQGSGGARTFTGTLVNRGEIVTNAFLTFDATSYTADGGDIGSLHRFRNSTITVADATTGGTTLNLEGTNTLATDNLESVTLWLRGAGGAGDATLLVSDGTVNHGVLRLESINTSWDETINVAGGTLHNAATGVIEINQGTGGSRDLIGSLTNNGTIHIDASRLLSLSDAGAFTLRHEGGLIDAQGEFRVQPGGALVWTGGDIAGTVRVDDGTIDAQATAGTGTVIAGGVTQLVNNSAATSTIWVQGSGATGNAALGLTGDAENRGVIRMESINTSWDSNIDTGAFTLTNEAGGLIEVNKGTSGDRRILGTIVNRGDIVVGVDEFLDITADYTADGGHVLGDHAFTGASVLRTTTAPTFRGDLSTLVLSGDQIQFEGDLLSGYELFIRGGASGGLALTTMTTDGAVNRGDIRLETVSSSWNTNLVVASNFTNATTGQIRALLGTGGDRTITGDSYTFTNRGEIFVEAGETLTFNSVNGFTLRQAQGEINADGLLDVVGGTFRMTGGDIDGSVRVNDGAIDIGAGLAGESTVIAAGDTTLQDNLSTLGTIWVQGAGATGAARLAADNPTLNEVTNLGTIRLETSQSTWASEIVAGPDTLVNGSTGVIDVQPGTGGPRRIAGSLRNEGLVTVAAGALLEFLNADYIGAGGSIVGEHVFDGTGTISFTADAGTTHALTVTGNGITVLTDVTAGHEVWSRGGGGYGPSLVNFAADTVNHGVVRLESFSSTWSSGMAVDGNDRWTNGANGELIVAGQSGGPRPISLLLDNAGVATFEIGAVLTGDADLGDVLNSGQWNMLSTETVAANSSSAETTTTFRNSGWLGGVGTLALDGGDGLFINSGELSPGLSVGMLTIDGSFEQTSTGSLTIELAAPGTFSGDRIAITEAATLDGAANVALLDSYIPDWGDRWSILTYDSVSGDLDVLAPALADPLLRWWSEATADSFDIGVRHIADVNHDDFVNFDDLNTVLSFFNMSGEDLPGDANEDGAVDFADLNLVVSFFNTQAPANVPTPGAAIALALGLLARRRPVRNRNL